MVKSDLVEEGITVVDQGDTHGGVGDTNNSKIYHKYVNAAIKHSLETIDLFYF